MPRIKFLKELWGYRPGDVTDFGGDDKLVETFVASGHLEIVPSEVPKQRTVAVKEMATGKMVDRMVRNAETKSPEPKRPGKR